MKNSRLQTKKAFGLLEVLISAGIIVVILGAMTVAARQSMKQTQSLQNRAQALYLAQEAIESLRQMRDTNWLNNTGDNGWDNMVYDASGIYGKVNYSIANNYVLRFDTNRFGVAPITDPSTQSEIVKIETPGIEFNRYLRIENVGGLIPNDNTNSAKQIVINAKDPASDNAMKVTVNVNWLEGVSTKSIQISEILTNWRPMY
ncbi:MAG: hypothetical protein NTW50_02485 [Candidatus Berkelbacteria bacterium]|nr:hypothetical protein [Candidatus Berkelbacteria bacterium]